MSTQQVVAGGRARAFRSLTVGSLLVPSLIVVGVVVAGLSAWHVDASGGGDDSTYVPVTPCRLFDTRSGPTNVGSRATPIGAGPANAHVQQVTGVNGDCDIPAGAVGVSLNVTVVNPTAQSNLRLYPEGVEPPTASNLNWMAGQGATPNKVDVKLSPAGRVVVQNHAGSVDVIADAVGYSTRRTLDDIEARLAALEAAGAGKDGDGGGGTDPGLQRRIDELEAANAELETAQAELAGAHDELATAQAQLQAAQGDLEDEQERQGGRVGQLGTDHRNLYWRVVRIDEEQSVVESTSLSTIEELRTPGPKRVLTLTVAPPADGEYRLEWFVTVQSEKDGGQVRCGVYPFGTTPSQISLAYVGSAIHTADDADRTTTLAASKSFDVSEGDVENWSVYCDQIGGAFGDTWIYGRTLTATFTPKP